MNKKIYILIIVIAFFLGMGTKLYKHFKAPSPLFYSELDLNKNDISYKDSFTFKKSGCYEVGLWSDGSVFDGQGVLEKTEDGMKYPLEGEYTLSYSDGDKLLKTKVITSANISSVSMNGLHMQSKLALDSFQTPFQNRFDKFNIKLTIKNPKDKFRQSTEQIYFFVDKAKTSCEPWVLRRKLQKKYGIKNSETNATLQPLFKALITRNTEKVKQIIDAGIDVNTKMIGNRRAVHYSSFVNDEETLTYLISKNADINTKDKLGKTPLHYGIENNATKTVKLLLDSGADLSLVKKVDNHLKIFGFDSQQQVILINYVVTSNLHKLTNILLQYSMDPNLIPYAPNSPWNPTALEVIIDHQDTCKSRYNENRKCRYPDYSSMIQLLTHYGGKTSKELEVEIIKEDKNGN